MPTYEYECKSCSHHFEAFQAISEEPIKICPECGKDVRRLIFGGAGVIFKGSGFYVTDKNKSSTSRSDKKSDTAADSGGGSTAAADSGSSKRPAASSGAEQKKPDSGEKAVPSSKTA